LVENTQLLKNGSFLTKWNKKKVNYHHFRHVFVKFPEKDDKI